MAGGYRKGFASKAIRGNAGGLLLEAEVGVLLDPNQQVVVTFEVFAEPVVISGVLTIFGAVLPAKIRAVFVDRAFVIGRQKIAAAMDHDVPGLPVDINGYLLVRDLPEQAFIIPSVFRCVELKRKIIATVSRETFFTLAHVVSLFIDFHNFILMPSGPKNFSPEGCSLISIKIPSRQVSPDRCPLAGNYFARKII